MTYEPIQMLNLETWIRDSLGLSPAISPFVTCGFVIMLYFLPLMVLSLAFGRDRDKIIPVIYMVLSVFLMGALTGIGWLPSYSWAIMAVWLALGVSNMVKEIF